MIARQYAHATPGFNATSNRIPSQGEATKLWVWANRGPDRRVQAVPPSKVEAQGHIGQQTAVCVQPLQISDDDASGPSIITAMG